MKKKKKVILWGLLFLSASLLSLASNNNSDYYVKLPEFSHPPKIDGQLENPLWQKGALLETFTQYEPQEGASPSEKTVAYLGYDKK
ncbi:MAG: hypothetical protein ACE5GI_03125, partial [Candidatus Aminicenantales bacterium]